jgi:hypothetical protein
MESKNANDSVTYYLELFEDVRDRVGDDRIALAIMHELAKDARMRQIAAERGVLGYQAASSAEETPATVRKLGLLSGVGLAIPHILSRVDASGLIDGVRAEQMAPVQTLPRRIP